MSSNMVLIFQSVFFLHLVMVFGKVETLALKENARTSTAKVCDDPPCCDILEVCCTDPCQGTCGGTGWWWGPCRSSSSFTTVTMVVLSSTTTTIPAPTSSPGTMTSWYVTTAAPSETTDSSGPTSPGTVSPTSGPVVSYGEFDWKLAFEVIACILGGGGAVTIGWKRKKIVMYFRSNGCSVRLANLLSFGVQRVHRPNGNSFGAFVSTDLGGQQRVWTVGDLEPQASESSSVMSGVEIHGPVVEFPPDEFEMTGFANPLYVDYGTMKRGEADGDSTV